MDMAAWCLTTLLQNVADGMACSPTGVVYFLAPGDRPGQVVRKLVGSTLETVIASENLPEDQQFSGGMAIFVTKEEAVYFTDDSKKRILRFNPAESLDEPVVAAHHFSREVYDLFVAEAGTIYFVASECTLFAVRPDGTAPIEVLQPPDPYCPSSVLAKDKSLYVGYLRYSDPGMEIESGCLCEYLLPPALELKAAGQAPTGTKL